MESALEVDLAKQEATAHQALNSALGQHFVSPSLDPSAHTAKALSTEQLRRSSKGGSATTTQPTLNPRASSSRRSPSPSPSECPEKYSNPGDCEDLTNAFHLQPVDEGFGAWSYAASAFAMYIVVWGFPQSFPIFQSHLSSGDSAQFPGSMMLPFLAPGLQDIEEGLFFQILPRSAKYRQAIVIAGIGILVLAMILASFATTALQIVATQGILFGLGGILLNFVHVSVFPEWFDQKRGQAMGFIWLGFRVGGLAFPLICQWLLDRHGYQMTLRVLIAPMLALLIPSTVLLRGRFPLSTVQTRPLQPAKSKLAVLRTPTLPFYLLIAVLFAAVTNVPMMFITKYAADLALDNSDRGLALSLVFLGNMLGPYLLGWLSDSAFRPWLMGASALSTSLLHLLFWGFVKTRLGLFGYAISVGIMSGGFRNCMFAYYSEVSAGSNEIFTAVHSIFSFFDGVAILSVGPVGTALLKLSPGVTKGAYAIGKYQPLMAYAGSMTMASGILALTPLCFENVKKLWSRLKAVSA